MIIENSKALAEIVNRYGLTRIEVASGDMRILIEKNAMAAPERQGSGPGSFPETTESDDMVSFNNMTEVKSPIIGVFYAAPSPDGMPYVTIGSKVKRGDVLCVVEAMKSLNEIQAEQDGEIMDICLKNGDIAEFGQVLFKMICM